MTKSNELCPKVINSLKLANVYFDLYGIQTFVCFSRMKTKRLSTLSYILLKYSQCNFGVKVTAYIFSITEN